MNKCLNYLALARKAGKIELGEEPVGAVARAQKAYLIVVAGDASDHTWRRAKSYVAGTHQQCVRVPYTKEEVGFVIGRTSLAMAAFTDAALALAFLNSLENPEKYQEARQVLEEKSQKLRQRQKEEKAHQRNLHRGRKKK